MIKNRESTTRKLFQLFKPFWKQFTVVFALILLSQALSLLLPYFLAKIIDAPSYEIGFRYIAGSFLIWVFMRSVLTAIRERYEIMNLDWEKDIFMHGFSASKLLGFSIG